MGLFTIEHSLLAYRLAFFLYTAAVLLIVGLLLPAWWAGRKSANAYHHHAHTPRHFGATTGVWDQITGTTRIGKETL